MYVAALLKTWTGLHNLLIAQLLARMWVVCGKMIAISLTFFGFTLGRTFAGGAKHAAMQGAESSVLLGGVRA